MLLLSLQSCHSISSSSSSSPTFFTWGSSWQRYSSSSSLATHNFTTNNSKRKGRRGRSSFCYVVCARAEDDYHATLKALNSRGRTPRKSLGQHYMLNSSVNEQLVGAADVKDGDVVLEIGPGTGSLTNVLLNSGATVLAIEKDPHMVAHLRERFANIDSFTVVLEEDFTKCYFTSHLISLLESGKSAEKAKVVSNIPFNISTDVVKQLLPMGELLSEVVLLLQDEAALRFVDASLRTPEYRPINIFVNFYSDPEYKFQVLRTNFFPQPNVDAAVVTFKLKEAADYPPVASTKSFFSMVNSAFNGKRKMLRRSLQHICPSLEIEKALECLGLPETSRPGELTLDNFVRLHNLIVKAEGMETVPAWIATDLAYTKSGIRLAEAREVPGRSGGIVDRQPPIRNMTVTIELGEIMHDMIERSWIKSHGRSIAVSSLRMPQLVVCRSMILRLSLYLILHYFYSFTTTSSSPSSNSS
ncbi:Ribosomal RNA adenine methylase transferase [Macleaya cordata]|uniref:rRNA adenine N(6)-methyltransferase n=1 Tax=Macleaya cordata TaxID=56857 RepID=A0A200R0B4_MACCD|nr:Ribosomal RNA adenine methylase transferase [Macleaya cordata]